MSEQPDSLLDILKHSPSHVQDRLLADWIEHRVQSLGALYHLFGSPPRGHPEYVDVMIRVKTHLLRPLPDSSGITTLQAAVMRRADLPLESRADAVLVKTLFQEYYKHWRDKNPAFSHFLCQLRYAVRRHGHAYGLVLTPRSSGRVEIIHRLTFHARKGARIPTCDDLLELSHLDAALGKGRAKLAGILAMLDAIERRPTLQPLLPVQALAKALTERIASEVYVNELSDPMESQETVKLIDAQLERAYTKTIDWLKNRYFRKIGASPEIQSLLCDMLAAYKERYRTSRSERSPSKDIILTALSGMTKRDYETSLLRQHVHYICWRFRRAIREN